MQKIKSHKTVEQIARKHRLDVSFIQKQLDMGEPIEHEHTQNHALARNIALQHLDEIPDYYTRLKKMESDAKKHHKKFKDVKVQEDLRQWFGTGGEGGVGGGGWDEYNTKGERTGKCARGENDDGKGPKPKCLSKEKAAKMTKSQIAAAVINKRREDPVADRTGKGGKPIMVSNNIKEDHNEETRYCPLCDKRETRSECSYGEKTWDKVSVKDEEYSMARGELETIMNAAKRLKNTVGKGEGNLEAWVQSKITKAADYIDTVADYIDGGEAKMQESCWTGYKRVGMKKKGKRMVPNCVPVNEICLTDKILLELEASSLSEENKPTNPKLWSKAKSLAKSKFDVYPSAYANGWAAKWYKSKGGGWKKTNESVTIEDANGNPFLEVTDLIKPEPIKGFKSQIEEATRLQSQSGNIIMGTLLWKGKYYSLKMFFPQINLPSRKDIEQEMQKVYPGSRLVHHQVSEFAPGEPLIQSCNMQGGSSGKIGPSKNYVKVMGEEVEIDEEGPSLSVGRGEKLPVSRGGGLTEKGRKKYNRATGSNLQAPVTGNVKPGSKAAKRRKAFCSRSRSWKGERGLAARRRWKC